jgi:hypothetical protein
MAAAGKNSRAVAVDEWCQLDVADVKDEMVAFKAATVGLLGQYQLERPICGLD